MFLIQKMEIGTNGHHGQNVVLNVDLANQSGHVTVRILPLLMVVLHAKEGRNK